MKIMTKNEKEVIEEITAKFKELAKDYEENTNLWELYLMNEGLFKDFIDTYTQKTNCRLSAIALIDTILRTGNRYIIIQSLNPSESFEISEELSKRLDPYFKKIENNSLQVQRYTL